MKQTLLRYCKNPRPKEDCKSRKKPLFTTLFSGPPSQSLVVVRKGCKVCMIARKPECSKEIFIQRPQSVAQSGHRPLPSAVINGFDPNDGD
ncbi:hypothetical protein J6590_091730 [Homalodisca vitripennis]|nr:hypothetical protein J6590_091730 [Homalodisca vitripennis]